MAKLSKIMANAVTERIQQELEEIIKSEEVATGAIKVELINDNYTELKGEIAGPSDTPYEGGNFVLEMKVPKTYPFNPPEVWFITNMWHPNICPLTGEIYMDILNDQWTATMTLRTVLLYIQYLLSAPQPDDPLNPDAARQFKENAEMFQMTAGFWSNAYAGGPHANKEFDDKIRKLIEMDVVPDLGEWQTIEILSSNNWNIQEAAKRLMLFHSILEQIFSKLE